MERVPLAQRWAEKIAASIGVKFLLVQTAIIAVWVAANVYWLTAPERFDRYPFILLNLALSLQAAYTGPVLLIAGQRMERQNQQLAKETHDHVAETHEWMRAWHEDQAAELSEHREAIAAIHQLVQEVHGLVQPEKGT